MFEKNKKSFTVDEIKRKLENYCVYQDRCHKEVEQKMREYQVIPEARELILLSLMKDNFLNEERFAKSYASVVNSELKVGGNNALLEN